MNGNKNQKLLPTSKTNDTPRSRKTILHKSPNVGPYMEHKKYRNGTLVYKPSMMGLLEPKKSARNIEEFARKIGFENYFHGDRLTSIYGYSREAIFR